MNEMDSRLDDTHIHTMGGADDDDDRTKLDVYSVDNDNHSTKRG
jgi:hypothetical protein